MRETRTGDVKEAIVRENMGYSVSFVEPQEEKSPLREQARGAFPSKKGDEIL